MSTYKYVYTYLVEHESGALLLIRRSKGIEQ
jgi:hypothetical protein